MRFLIVATALASVLGSAPAFAQTGDDKALALSLFEDGRSLAKQGKYQEAAQKFEAAANGMRTYGILYNLAQCYDKLGRTASAWSTWREAKSIAEEEAEPKRTEDEQNATQAEQALALRLSRLSILVPVPAERNDLVVLRDGAAVPKGAWGSASPIDPGRHVIEARAPGYKPWSTTLNIVTDGDQRTVTVPPLEPEAAPPAALATAPLAAASAPQPAALPAPSNEPPTQDTARSSGSTQRIIGGSVAAGGAIVATVGLVEYLGGQSKIDSAVQTASTANSQGDRTLYETAQPKLNDGSFQRNFGGVLLGIGGTALAGGLITLLAAPSGAHTSAASYVAPWVGVHTGGLAWLGHW